LCRIGQNLRFSISVAVRRRLAAASRFLTSRVCHGNGANVLRKVLQISDETLIWGPSCLITCDSEYPRPRRWNASRLRPRQSGRSIHSGPDATMLICSARRRQTTSNEPDRLRLLPMAWARDEIRSELPTKRSRKPRQWSLQQQPSTHTALWTVDGLRGNRTPKQAKGTEALNRQAREQEGSHRRHRERQGKGRGCRLQRRVDSCVWQHCNGEGERAKARRKESMSHSICWMSDLLTISRSHPAVSGTASPRLAGGPPRGPSGILTCS